MPRPDLTADVDPRETLLDHLRDDNPPDDLRALYQHAIDHLDFTAGAEIQAHHIANADPKNASPIRRSFDAGRFLRRAFIFCQEPGLVKSPPLSIFDISCGTGYFAYAARFFGHDVTSLDKPSRFTSTCTPGSAIASSARPSSRSNRCRRRRGWI